MSQVRPRERLDALTSLRFFAAAAIVWLHFQGHFGIPHFERAMLGQAVSYFFVLSGFVLTYVYPSLPNGAARRNFLVARIARLWPAHVVGIVLAVFLARDGWAFLARPGWVSHLNLVANVFMVQAWTTLEGRFFSINGPSWSISTEFGLYFAFLLLIGNFEKTWGRKLLLSVAIVAALILIGVSLGIKWDSPRLPAITQESLLYMFPLSRLLEFTAGMSVALLYRKQPVLERLDSVSTTAIEIAIVGLIVVYAVSASYLGLTKSNPFIEYLKVSAVVPACLAVYVFAQQRGLVSRILQANLLVLLGELSYSIYLLHVPLLAYFTAGKTGGADPVALIACLAVIISLSYLNWLYVEMPGRRAIKRLFAKAEPRSEVFSEPGSAKVASG